MTVTVNIKDTAADELRRQAALDGEDFEVYVAERLEELAGSVNKSKSGAELLTEWEREGILLKPEGRPSDEYLRQVREAAPHRDHGNQKPRTLADRLAGKIGRVGDGTGAHPIAANHSELFGEILKQKSKEGHI
jgi:hypothetical protein